jgi:hypothetical protein
MKSGDLNFLEPSGPLQACNRTTLPLLLPPSCAVVMKSGNLNFLEPSGPLQACNGTALRLYLHIVCVDNSLAEYFFHITERFACTSVKYIILLCNVISCFYLHNNFMSAHFIITRNQPKGSTKYHIFENHQILPIINVL